MAASKLLEIASLLPFRWNKSSYKYSYAPITDHQPLPLCNYEVHPSTNISSFEESLNKIARSDTPRLTHWPNFTVMSIQHDHSGHSIKSRAASTIEIVPKHQMSQATQTQRQSSIPYRIRLMCTRFIWRDMSWLVGVSFAIGSAVFVINAFFLLLPQVAPSTNFSTEAPYATPASSIIGTIIFIVGSWVAVLEALNLTRGGEVIEGVEMDYDSSKTGQPQEDGVEGVLEKVLYSHHRVVVAPSQASPREAGFVQINKMLSNQSHHTDKNIIVPLQRQHSYHSSHGATIMNVEEIQAIGSSSRSSSADSGPSISNATPIPLRQVEATDQDARQPALLGAPTFMQWPTGKEYRTLYQRNLLFNASAVQFVGSIVFGVASLTAVPGVVDLTDTTTLYVANLFPATLGGLLFLIAGILQTLNVQDQWYKPNPGRLDWHVGMWNTIGSAGFTLAGALPYFSSVWSSAALLGTIADLGGSWAFFFGGILQWYASLERYC